MSGKSRSSTSRPSTPPAQLASIPVLPISSVGVGTYGGLKRRTSMEEASRGRRERRRSVCRGSR